MKKLFLVLAMIVSLSVGVSAKDTYAHDASVLPKAAQTVLTQNVKSKVSLVKIDKDFGRVSEYEVIMDDGTEVSFDRDGNWKNIEVNNSKSVPSSFVPKAIADYVKKVQKNTRIVGIEKERNGYEVELSNGVDMKFDKNGNFIRYED